MRIKTDFYGANIEVISEDRPFVRIRPALRDTATKWFYWAFCVEGAQCEEWTFEFPEKNYIGYFGPAVSRDLNQWNWADTDMGGSRTGFTYRFGPDESHVYFAHSMLYSRERFHRFANDNGIPVRSIAFSEKNNPVEIAEFGMGGACVVLTSRHHCCESTGSYVLEGMLRELHREPLPGLSVIAMPFVDIDGVINGDQGKNRRPHDHNRDYIQSPIYRSTAALTEYTRGLNVKYLFDLHSPWHCGGRNDTCFFVSPDSSMDGGMRKIGEILQSVTRADPCGLKYSVCDNLEAGEDWNTGDAPTCAAFFAKKASVELSLTFETMYFGIKDNMVTQRRLVLLGESLAKALREYDRVK